MITYLAEDCPCKAHHACKECLGSGVRHRREELPDTVDEAIQQIARALREKYCDV